ncbi:helix-turn-helix domain-containing protein [Orenia metallireducens]|uniref:helix-turn-helix domain-containing protein n=1 Tax=Orenia metallireducens TaxID=1413210 RepID=UPI00159F2903|nr:helix-turn-helix domain-containing protein [Orenia metallireducens]
MDSVFLTVKEVADSLNISDKTVYKYIENKQLKSVKFGNAIRINLKSLINFIKESTKGE